MSLSAKLLQFFCASCWKHFSFCRVQLPLYHTPQKNSRKKFQKGLIFFLKTGIMWFENTKTKRVGILRRQISADFLKDVAGEPAGTESGECWKPVRRHMLKFPSEWLCWTGFHSRCRCGVRIKDRRVTALWKWVVLNKREPCPVFTGQGFFDMCFP